MCKEQCQRDVNMKGAPREGEAVHTKKSEVFGKHEQQQQQAGLVIVA